MGHDVLSDSELNAPQSHAVQPNMSVIGHSIGNEEFYESDGYHESTEFNISRLSKSKSQTIKYFKHKDKDDDDDIDSNKSLPLNIASAKHKKNRSQSLTSKQLAAGRSKSSISASLKQRNYKK